MKVMGELSTMSMDHHLVRDPRRHNIVARRMENESWVLIDPRT